jgi:hypothetical protein
MNGTVTRICVNKNNNIDGDLRIWPKSDMSTTTSIPVLSAGTSIPYSFRPPSSPTGCHSTFGLHHYSIDKNVTYGTISPHAYNPSIEKPWQGIWCGDYFDHGAEFLLMLQPDPTNTPQRKSLLVVKLTSPDDNTVLLSLIFLTMDSYGLLEKKNSELLAWSGVRFTLLPTDSGSVSCPRPPKS